MSASTSDEKLCDTCAAAPIRRLLTSYSTWWEYELGSWTAIKKKAASCPLCLAIVTTAQNGPRTVREKWRQHDSLILRPQRSGLHHPNPTTGLSDVLANRIEVCTQDFQDVGSLLLGARDAHAIGLPPYFHGREIGCQHIDFQLIAGWLGECDEFHLGCKGLVLDAEECMKLPSESILIDTQFECLVWASAVQKYAALSYRWGSAGRNLLVKDVGQSCWAWRKPILRTAG